MYAWTLPESTGFRYSTSLKTRFRVVFANPKFVNIAKGNKVEVKTPSRSGFCFVSTLWKATSSQTRISASCDRLPATTISWFPWKTVKKSFQNAFTVCNVTLDSIVSDMFGNFATAIRHYFTFGVSFNLKHCAFMLISTLEKITNIRSY